MYRLHYCKIPSGPDQPLTRQQVLNRSDFKNPIDANIKICKFSNFLKKFPVEINEIYSEKVFD